MVSHGAEHLAITSSIRTGKETIITMLCNSRFVSEIICAVIWAIKDNRSLAKISHVVYR